MLSQKKKRTNYNSLGNSEVRFHLGYGDIDYHILSHQPDLAECGLAKSREKNILGNEPTLGTLNSKEPLNRLRQFFFSPGASSRTRAVHRCDPIFGIIMRCAPHRLSVSKNNPAPVSSDHRCRSTVTEACLWTSDSGVSLVT